MARRIPRPAGAIALSLALTTLAAGCGDGVDRPPLPFTSGSRLRAIVLDAGGGAVSFAGWHDRELDVDCRFEPTDGGAMRCLPTEAGMVVYADEACTTPIVLAWPGTACGAPRFARAGRLPGDACAATPTALFAVGAPLESDVAYAAFGGACQRLPGVGADLFALGPAVDPATLATADQVGVEPRGGGLLARVLATPDGATQVIEALDATGVDCARYRLPTGEDVCLGATASTGAAVRVFEDDACATPVPAAYDACDAEAPAAIIADGGQLRLPGPRIVGGLHVGSPGACGPDSRYTGYELGRPATAADFPAMSAVRLGSGRIKAVYGGDPGGGLLVAEDLEDSASGRTCTLFGVAGETDLRCVALAAGGGGGSSTTYYGDAACTTPVTQWLAAGAAPDGPFVEAASACGPFATLRSAYTVKAVEGPTYRRDQGACVAGAPTWDLVPYVVDRVLPLDELPVVTRRIE